MRQTRLHGAPVFETRLRVPGRRRRAARLVGRRRRGVHRRRGRQRLAAADRLRLHPARPPHRPPADRRADPGHRPAAGETIVLPIGHRTSVTRRPRPRRPARGPLPPGLPAPRRRRAGWVALAERASRARAARRAPGRGGSSRPAATSLLAGPPDVADDPVGLLLALGELVRLGRADDDAVAVVARRRGARSSDRRGARAGTSTPRSTPAASCWRAAASAAPSPTSPGSPPRRTPSPCRRTADGDPRRRRPSSGAWPADGVLLPDGIPAAWRGVDFEAHGLPVGPASTVSFAVRWHGEHAGRAVGGRRRPGRARRRRPSTRRGARRATSGEALWRRCERDQRRAKSTRRCVEVAVDGRAGAEVAVEERPEDEVDERGRCRRRRPARRARCRAAGSAADRRLAAAEVLVERCAQLLVVAAGLDQVGQHVGAAARRRSAR